MSSSKSLSSCAFAPGKVMLAGEWAVLEVGNSCVVLTIDKGVTAEVKPSDLPNGHISLQAPDVDLDVKFLLHEGSCIASENKAIRFAWHAIEYTVKYLQEQGREIIPVSIEINSDISSIKVGEKRMLKPGLGSSAATVVAVTKALLLFYGFDVESDSGKDLVFKLASIANCVAQDFVGSCYDIAAATYGGPLVYKRFDPLRFKDMFTNKQVTITDMINALWSGLEIKKINLPKDLWISIGFVGESAKTKELIEQIKDYKKHNKNKYLEDISLVGRSVKELTDACKKNKKTKFLGALRDSRAALQTFQNSHGVQLETAGLAHLCDIAQFHGCAAKFSGAGGGDCGIAVSFDDKQICKTMDEWKKNGVTPIAFGRVDELQLV